ncbi:hypothetical protein PT974_09969 [Cladobotryum mycophilum]|uniref:CENP-V/GFA domain-containing protein n=1 Tax=Cladobotryum mycophilum TaxID=491253 RepID=A0ABR0S9H5_9HYPO
MASVTTGSCACDAIQFQYTGEPQLTGICHCTICRKWTGSAFTTNAIIPKEALEITKGTPKSWKKQGHSGNYVFRYFCSDCGSPLWGDVEIFPGALFVKAGVLDGEAAHLNGKIDQIWWHDSKLRFIPEIEAGSVLATQDAVV